MYGNQLLWQRSSQFGSNVLPLNFSAERFHCSLEAFNDVISSERKLGCYAKWERINFRFYARWPSWIDKASLYYRWSRFHEESPSEQSKQTNKPAGNSLPLLLLLLYSHSMTDCISLPGFSWNGNRWTWTGFVKIHKFIKPKELCPFS